MFVADVQIACIIAEQEQVQGKMFFLQFSFSFSWQDNPPFAKEITQAKFYYVDKFVLLACGNGLHMYKYHIDVGQKDDVKR